MSRESVCSCFKQTEYLTWIHVISKSWTRELNLYPSLFRRTRNVLLFLSHINYRALAALASSIIINPAPSRSLFVLSIAERPMPRPFTTITPRIFSVSLIKLTRVLVDSRSERRFAWRFVPSVTGRLLPGTAAQLVCFNSLRKRKKEKRKTWKKEEKMRSLREWGNGARK